jgi:LmbE family N-acetylglucosaminyl deacetylase
MDLRNAAIVVAHPDDEVLWFSSLAARVGLIVLCYGPNQKVLERGAQRWNVVRSYPFRGIQFLNLPEPGLWQGRTLGSVEEELARSAQEDPMLRKTLVDRLGEILQGVTTVLVHNPWGEYGHDDHRRLYLAVNALRQQIHFSVYVPTYVERRALNLMAATLDEGVSETLSFPVDRAEIDPIVKLYQSNGCWTWSTDWRWPKEEHFLRIGQGTAVRDRPLPFHLFGI